LNLKQENFAGKIAGKPLATVQTAQKNPLEAALKFEKRGIPPPPSSVRTGFRKRQGGGKIISRL
jgi:hypothetical protein